MEDAKTILCHLADTEMLTDKQQQAILEIAVFLKEPILDKMQLTIGHAQLLKRGLLDGGLLKDCLSLVASLDAKTVKELKELAAAE